MKQNKNLAIVCYMNSVLQQLYMMPSFRKGLLELEHSEAEPKSNDLLFYLKLLFGALKATKKESYSAAHLCSLIKDFDGRPLSIYEQHDADEFFNLLMDRLESGLKSTNRPQLIKDVFAGAFVNEVICIDCPHRSAVKEEFLAVNLQIHNKKGLTEALQAYIEAEQLAGSNAYHCERCDKKVTAKKRVSLGVLPNVLIVVLKRFEFDFQRKYPLFWMHFWF